MSYYIYIENIDIYYYGYTNEYKKTKKLIKEDLMHNRHESYLLQEAYNYFNEYFIFKPLSKNKELTNIIMENILLKNKNILNINTIGLKNEIYKKLDDQYKNRFFEIKTIEPSSLFYLIENNQKIKILLKDRRLKDGYYKTNELSELIYIKEHNE